MITTKLPKEYQGQLLDDLDRALSLMIPTIDLVEQTTASMTWALTEEESNLGLAAMGDDDLRRENVKAKWRSQFDVTSFSDIVQIAASFRNGDIAADYKYPTITITFVSILGHPKNLANLKAAIRDVIPAHIAINYIFKYRMNSELTKYTHAQLHAYTHTEIREGELTSGN